MNQQVTLLDALRAVPGVASADIEPDDRPEGAGTLRLQLSPGADEVQVATSVNRVLREQFGLAVDANRVQVVEESVGPPPVPQAPAEGAVGEDVVEGGLTSEAGIDEESAEEGGYAAPAAPRPTLTAVPEYREPSSAEEQPGPAPEEALEAGGHLEEVSEHTGDEALAARSQRILIQRMQLVSAGLGVSTEVTLTWAGQPFAGEAAAAATPSSVHRSVAQATLRAVESVIGGRARFELEQLEINQLGPDRAVVVVVSMLTKAGSERLTGVSVVREDVRQAVIRATLDSLNRRIESLLAPA